MDTSKGSKPAGQNRPWRGQDGVNYISVTSNGMTGEQWLAHFKARGNQIEALAKRAILSPNFKPSKGVKIEIVILKGNLFNDSGWTVGDIRASAAERHLTIMSVETACLIRDMFTDEEINKMGFSYIFFMHETARDSSGNPFWLNMDCEFGGGWLGAYCDLPDRREGDHIGFAFAVLPVDSQN